MKLFQLSAVTTKRTIPWLPHLKRFTFSAGFMALVGSAFGAIIVSIFQEPVEVKIQSPKESMPLENVLGLNQEEFSQFPVHWRQVFATVASEPNSYHPMTKKMLSSNSIQTGDFIQTLAARVIEGKYVVRDNSVSTRHTFVSPQMFSDFLDLEALGFLQAADTGLEATIRTEDSKGNLYFNILSTTDYRILVLHTDSEAAIKLPVTTLTAAGQEIVGLLREPNDSAYVKWVVDQIREQGFDVTVWSNWTDTKGENEVVTTQLRFPVDIDKDLVELDILPKYLLDAIPRDGNKSENQ